MAKAKRPIYIPQPEKPPYVREIMVEFEWFPGFALSQAQKSIDSHHFQAQKLGYNPILEISSKSRLPLGVQLSAFNLMLKAPGQSGKMLSVECAFQGSKVFENGGPYTDLYLKTSQDAKQDERLKTSGKVVGFQYFGIDFPTQPVNVFYDRLYFLALGANQKLSNQLTEFQGFTDIKFNPEKSWNCQARSAALFVAFTQAGIIKQIVEERDFYLRTITNTQSPKIVLKSDKEQLKFL